MKEKNLREFLEKCSKAELIKVVLKASDMTFTSFPWLTMIAEIRLDEVEAKIETNLAEGRELTRKFSEMAENQHNYSNNEVLEIRIALTKNHEKWKQLISRQDKILKELYV